MFSEFILFHSFHKTFNLFKHATTLLSDWISFWRKTCFPLTRIKFCDMIEQSTINFNWKQIVNSKRMSVESCVTFFSVLWNCRVSGSQPVFVTKWPVKLLGYIYSLRSVHTVRQRLRQRCRYQLDSIVTSGVVHTSICGSCCGSGAASK